MTKVVSVDQMRRIERAADAAGLSYDAMMRKAGAAVADAAVRLVGDPRHKRVLILVGSGNNGGDGLVAGCRLIEAGAAVTAVIVGARPSPDPHAANLERLGGTVMRVSEIGVEAIVPPARSADLVIDAVLGTGFRLPLRGMVEEALRKTGEIVKARRPRPLVIAVDCPSGVDCDSGEAARGTLDADLTVTLGAVKAGLLRFPAAARTGRLVVGEIGLDPKMPELAEVSMEVADAQLVREWLPRRPADSHKGTFGTAMIAGGSVNYPGSVALAGRAAYRVGAGLVCLAVPGSIQLALVSALPEATWLILPQEVGVLAEPAAEILRRESVGKQALLVGPGLGREEPTRRFMARLVTGGEAPSRGRIGFIHDEKVGGGAKAALPQLVIDADGLRLLADHNDWPTRMPPGSILTPHPGEMAAITGLDTQTIQANREGVAREKAAEWGHIIVLKGAHTVVAAPDGRAWVLPFATAALAKAGTGDVLAGAIAGLCAQGVGAVEASVLGAYLHGRAGELAEAEWKTSAGVLAGEVADRLPEAISELAGS